MNGPARRRALAALLAGAAVLAGSGCAVNRATASADPSMRWDAVRSLHVVQMADERDESTKQLIVARLRRAGYAVTADPAPDPPADARVTYSEKWMWDITMYMLELTVVFRDPQTGFPLVTGHSFHTSLSRKSQVEMVEEVLGNMLKQRP